jgi:hypothetical protein
MIGDNKKENKADIIEILENVNVIYVNGERTVFQAILLTDNGDIIFGRLLKVMEIDNYRSFRSIGCDEIFIEGGGIPKDNVKQIDGGIKKMVIKNFS